MARMETGCNLKKLVANISNVYRPMCFQKLSKNRSCKLLFLFNAIVYFWYHSLRLQSTTTHHDIPPFQTKLVHSEYRVGEDFTRTCVHFSLNGIRARFATCASIHQSKPVHASRLIRKQWNAHWNTYFLRSLDFLADWPVDLLVAHPENCLFHYFR